MLAVGVGVGVGFDTGAGAATPAAPVNTVAPAISGTPTTGQTLSCSTGSWTGFPVPTYAYQWKRDGVEIVGETASTYVVVTADAGTTLTCTVTATNSEGSASATSAGVTGNDPATTAANLVIAGFAVAPSAGRQTAIRDLIQALMNTAAVAATPAVSIWDVIDRLYVFRASEDQGSRINWKAPGTGNAAKTGTGGSFTVDVGWSATDASNYTSTGFNPSTDAVLFARNSNSFFASTTTDANDVVSAAIAGNTQFSLQPRSSTGVYISRNASTGQDTGSANTGAGLYGSTRNVSTGYNRWKGAALVDSPTRTSTAHLSAVVYVGTHNLTNFSNKPVGFLLMAGYLDATAVAALDTGWSAYVAAL